MLDYNTMSDNAESVLVRLQHLVLHDPIVPDNDVASMVEDKLGQQEQQRPELFPAGNLQATAEGGENTNEIDVAKDVQVELPREAPRRRVGVTSLRMKRKWEAHLIHRVPPRVQVHGRKKKRPAVQFLGFFDTADQAQQAYANAILELTMIQLEQIQLADNAGQRVVPVNVVVQSDAVDEQ